MLAVEYFFFFQAEDGIRDLTVTGVQTCALPILRRLRALAPTHGLDLHGSVRSASLRVLVGCRWSGYRKRKLARALLIATKLDAYRRRAPSPIAERYFEAARRQIGRASCRERV